MTPPGTSGSIDAMARVLKIGISARFTHPDPSAIDVRSKTVQYLEQSVAHWVMSRDVMVFMVPSVAQDGLIHRSNIRLRDYARELDGLVLQGGADLSPSSYGEEPLRPEWTGDPVRDDYEIELFNEFVEAGKPVLGVCRGAQLVNVAFGGTLWQDIATQVPQANRHRSASAYEHNFHDVSFVPETGLARLYPGVATGRVNSIHHQGVRKLGRDLRIEAWSEPDRVVEAVRWTGRGYVLGIQWHPEFMSPADESLLDCAPILDEFLHEVRRRT